MVIGDQRPSVDHSKKTKNSDIFIFFLSFKFKNKKEMKEF